MASNVARAKEREAADRQIVDLGFVYPDAIDIRSALPRGHGHAPDPGSATAPAATQARTQSAEGTGALGRR